MHKIKGAHIQCVTNKYAKFEYKGMKTVGVTDYTHQTKHFRWQKCLSSTATALVWHNFDHSENGSITEVHRSLLAPQNAHKCEISSYESVLTCLGAKNLIETALLSTHNISFG